MEAIMRNGNIINGRLAETFVKIGIAVPVSNKAEKKEPIEVLVEDSVIDGEISEIKAELPKKAEIIKPKPKVQNNGAKRGRKPNKKAK